MTEAETRSHHPYSPSTLNSLEWCPCYRSRQSDKPHQRTTAGTRAHEMVQSGEDDSRLTDEDAAAAAECLDFIEQRKRGMIQEAEETRIERQRNQDKTPVGEVQELQEAYLPVDDLTFPDCKGTTAGWVDHALINFNQTYAEAFDWKFGFWPVEKAEENLQGISYALGLFKQFPTLNTVVFFFKQPHLEIVDKATFTRAQVPELYLRVQTVVARAREARTTNSFFTAKPGIPICSFCSELGRCEKVCAFACKVGRKFHPLEIPENITPSLVQDPKETSLGLRLASVLKVWCDAFRRQVTDRILRGEAPLPPGQKIQEMSKRQIVDLEKFKTVCLRYLTREEYERTLESSFGAVEDLIQEKTPRGQKKNVISEFQKALLDAGAVAHGDKFSFLRAVAEK